MPHQSIPLARALNLTLRVPYQKLNMSAYSQNVSTILTGEKTRPILEYYVYMLVGTFISLVFLIGFSENVCVLYVYWKNKQLQKCRNAFLICLALNDLGQAIFNLPFVVTASFLTNWPFGHAMCQYYAFITSMLGLTQITILTVIAMERYLLIVRHKKVFTRNFKTTVCTVIACFLHGALWSLAPLLGWSRYKLEAGDISCSVDWDLHNTENLSFVFSLFVCVWFIPLGVIIFSYSSIVYLVVIEKRKRHVFNSSILRKKNQKERTVAVTCLIMTVFFVITWMPYSIVSLWAALDNIENIPELVQMSTAFFAKSSIIWNPVIYFVRNNGFRSACINSVICFRLLARNKDQHSAANTRRNANVTKENNTSETKVLLGGKSLQTSRSPSSFHATQRETRI